MLSSGRMKYCAPLLIIVIVLINTGSLEARRISGGHRSGGRSYGGRSNRPSGGISKPSTPVYRPPVYHPPVYRPPPHVPSPVPHTPSVSHTPHTSHTSGPTNGKHSSDVLIKSEGGGQPRPGSSGNPHQPTAPVHDSATRTTVGNQNAANPHGTNAGSAYPPWANPSANPHAPSSSNPQPSQPYVPYPNAGKPPGSMTSPPYNPSFPNAGKPPGPMTSPPYNPSSPNAGKPPGSMTSPPYNPSFPNAGKPPGPMTSAPYPPIHPPGPISHQPINPSHQNPLNSGVPHGPPPPYSYQPPPPYPGGHPQGMPMPSPPHAGFGNGGHTNVPYPPIGNTHNYHPNGHTPGGGIPPHTVINNHYHSSSPPIGSPQNPAGHPMSVHQPVYGGAPMAQPFVPGQTVLVLPNQSPQSSGPGFGQILKEALVFSTVNAGVNRLINGAPHHHHDSYQPSPSTGTSSTSTTTNTVIYNQYGNPIPGTNGNPIPPTNGNPIQGMPQTGQPGVPPGSPPTFPAGQSMGNTNYPAGSGGVNPAVVNPGIGSSSSGTPSYGGSSAYPSPAATGTGNAPQGTNIPATNAQQTGSSQPIASNTTNNQTAAYPVQTYQYYISDDELANLTERLFAKDELDASKYIKVNLQKRSSDPNATDQSSGPLLYVQPEAYDIPTIQALRSLFDNYEFDSEKKEVTNKEKRQEENMMLDVFLNTNIMKAAMQWLTDKSYIEPDDFEWKDTLRHIWFSKVNSATSGFERIFMAEKYAGPSILGGQNWIYFDFKESLRHINYLSYVEEASLGGKASMVKVNFKIDDVVKPNTTMLVGTPPELEMALYTICYYTRPNDACPISLGGRRLNIYTHTFRYFGKDLIDLGLVFF